MNPYATITSIIGPVAALKVTNWLINRLTQDKAEQETIFDVVLDIIQSEILIEVNGCSRNGIPWDCTAVANNVERWRLLEALEDWLVTQNEQFDGFTLHKQIPF